MLVNRKSPITAKEAAEMLGISYKTVLNGGAGTSKLTKLRFGRSVRFVRQEVEKLVETKYMQALKGRPPSL